VTVGFIVSGYKRPDLLVRLVRALEGRPCAIHIDAKSPVFNEVSDGLKDALNVHFLSRHTCHWGLFGHVEASLKGLRWLRTTECDYVVLLTGQCYPLLTIETLERRLRALNGCSIIDHQPFPHPRWEGGGWPRIDRFYINALGRPRPIKLWRRQMPFGFHPFGGGSYWCLSRTNAEEILEFVDSHPDIVRFFKRVLIPDEIFFQTILSNSLLRDSLINDTIHYVEWTFNQPSPSILTSVDKAFASGKWFARKLEDMRVVDIIDERRRENSDRLNALITPALSSPAEGN
jgi:hypothetical protein